MKTTATAYVILVDRELKQIWLRRPNNTDEEDFWCVPSFKSEPTDHRAVAELVEHLDVDGLHVQIAEKVSETFEAAYPDGEEQKTGVLDVAKYFVARVYTEHDTHFVSEDNKTVWQSFDLESARSVLAESPYDNGLEILQTNMAERWLA